MLKNILLISLLSSLTLGLTACGSDSDSTTTDTVDADKKAGADKKEDIDKKDDADKEDCGCNGSKDNVKDDGDIADDEISFSEVLKRNNPETKNDYIVRHNIFFKTGQSIQESKISVLGELSAEKVQPTHYRLAPNYYSAKTFKKASETMIVEKIDDNTKKFTVDVVGKGDNDQVRNLTFSYELTRLDISGVTKDSTRFSTVLSSFDLPNAVFPEGSQCSVYSKSAHSFPHLSITADNSIQERSIDAWLAKQQSTRTDIIGQQEIAVGANNEHKAVYLKLTDDKNTVPAVINFYGKLYGTSYSQFTESTKNIDPSTAKVNCDGYNNIATEYLETQIQENITLADLIKK